MATAIKAIPTLYGEEARRFRNLADKAERRFDRRPMRDITKLKFPTCHFTGFRE